MNRVALFALTAVTAAVLAGSLSAAVEVGDAGPSFKFEKSWNFDEGITELQHLRGKVVMIESWATW